MESMFVFIDITKFAYFRWKNADVGRTQKVSYVINILDRSKLYAMLCQRTLDNKKFCTILC